MYMDDRKSKKSIIPINSVFVKTKLRKKLFLLDRQIDKLDRQIDQINIKIRYKDRLDRQIDRQIR